MAGQAITPGGVGTGGGGGTVLTPPGAGGGGGGGTVVTQPQTFHIGIRIGF